MKPKFYEKQLQPFRCHTLYQKDCKKTV